MSVLYQYTPTSDNFVLRQIVSSTATECGHRVFILTKPIETDLIMSDSLKHRILKIIEKYPNERVVCVQIAQPSKPFLRLEDDTQVLLLYETVYLKLLTFFKTEYSIVCEKLSSESKALSNKEFIPLTETLSLRGVCSVFARKYLGKFENSFFVHLVRQNNETIVKIESKNTALFGARFFPLSVYAMQILSNDFDYITEKLKAIKTP